jgi:hypothetical protein
MRFAWVVTWLTWAGAAGAARSAEVSFTAGPEAVRQGAGVKITFSVSAATDAEVAVVDPGGGVVRRLAAGLLGENAPAPFQKGLKQELTWDGEDDAGAAADPAKGPYSVRVSLGLSAVAAGTAFGSSPKPGQLTNVIGLSAGPDGRVYVLSEPWNRAWWRSTAIHVFKPTGEYEKTIKPFPAGTPADKLAGLTALRDEQGRAVPVIHRVLAMSFYPHEDAAQHFAVAPDGTVHLLTIRASYYVDREDEKWLASLASDGSLAYPAYAGAEIKGETGPHDVYLAAASDSKSVFVTGMDAGRGSRADRPNVPAVYRIDLPDRKEAKVFFGDPAKAGADEKSLGDPRGLATDVRGRLFVADRTNNRVVILDEKSGTVLGGFPSAAPTWIGVSRKGDTVYVAGGAEIVTHATSGDSFAEKGRIKLPAMAGRGAESAARSFALSEADGKVALWIGTSRGPNVLLRCAVNADGTFGDWKPAGYEPAQTYWNIAAAQDGHTVACKVGGVLRVLDEQTGKTRDIPVGGSGETFRFGPNNQIYGIINGSNAVRRMDKDGRSLPFPAAKGTGGRLPIESSGTTSWERDLDIDRAGNVYVKVRGKVYHGRMTVDKYDKDGNRLGTVLWVVSDGAYGPRVDAAGNLYIADSVKPVGQPVPEFFKGKLPDVRIDRKANVVMQYMWMYGSILKFTPAGGAVWFPKRSAEDAYAYDGEAKLPAAQTRIKVEMPYNAGGGSMVDLPGEVQGAEWMRYGCSYVLDMHPGANRRCHCTATEIDVDHYGRLVYTDQGRFRVVMLDAAGNEILAFGRYGNQDRVPAEGGEIGFHWFTGLGVTDRNVYVADGGNHRVLRVALKPAAEETCQIRP